MIKKIVIILLLLVSPLVSEAQYYSQGASPASLRWKQVRTNNNRIIFSDDYQSMALRAMHYLDTLHRDISYGFSYGAMRVPIVIKSHNFNSNGLVMWMPKRMELITVPPASTFAEPWLKQLTSHELRHAVQFNNVNKNTIKGLSYLIGDQGSFIGTALLPQWFIEGDAVLAETELADFGRGVQPSFSIEYRAMLESNRDKYSFRKWFCGSDKDFIPDHYQLGYQIVSWTYSYYGENLWDKVANYASKYPFTIVPNYFALHKYYRSSARKAFKGTMDNLQNHWNSLPVRNNSSRVINTPITSYTRYSHPIAINDTTIIAFKSDMDRFSRVVMVNRRTSIEKTIAHTGYLNSTPCYHNGYLYWTESRSSVLWSQQTYSQLCYLDLATEKKGECSEFRQVMFPTSMGDNGLAVIEYDYSGRYSIRTPDLGLTIDFADTISLHGLAYDDLSDRLYFIALSDAGMWIGSTSGYGKFNVVKKPSRASINDLKAEGGKLYFTSIESGFDEAHAFDIAQDMEYRLTTSKYGSFSPSPIKGTDSVVVTTYTPQGYLLATQATDDNTIIGVEESYMPRNIVNPPRRHWDVKLNLDSVVVSDTTHREIKPFRKGLNMFKVHSWAPISFDPEQLIDEQSLNIYAGATFLSQDLISSTSASLGYGWTENGSLFSGQITYQGIAPHIDLDFEYGGGKQLVYGFPSNIAPPTNLNNYFTTKISIYLPMILSDGYRVRYLQPIVGYDYANSLLYESSGEFKKGLNKLSAYIYYSDNVRPSVRDLLPRWGYAFKGGMVTEPTNSDFTLLRSIYARAYLPGIFLHHSTMLRASYQQQGKGKYYFRQKDLFPRGADYNNVLPMKYWAFSADYQFTVAYPDFAILDAIYLRRVRMNLGVDYARYRQPPNNIGISTRNNLYSYGGDIILDINPFCGPAPTVTSVRISVYKPSDRNGVVVGFDLTLPI